MTNTLPKPSLTPFHYLHQRLHKFPRILTSRRPPRAVTRHVVRFAQPVVHPYFMQGAFCCHGEQNRQRLICYFHPILHHVTRLSSTFYLNLLLR